MYAIVFAEDVYELHCPPNTEVATPGERHNFDVCLLQSAGRTVRQGVHIFAHI